MTQMVLFCRKNMMETELVRSKNDMMSLNNQLLEAIQRKLELSQELEAWQVSLFCFFSKVHNVLMHHLSRCSTYCPKMSPVLRLDKILSQDHKLLFFPPETHFRPHNQGQTRIYVNINADFNVLNFTNLRFNLEQMFISSVRRFQDINPRTSLLIVGHEQIKYCFRSECVNGSPSLN